MIFWFLGISGSGKSTLGKKLKTLCDEKKIVCVYIDGDDVRTFFDRDLGHSKEERVHAFKRIAYGAYMAAQVCPVVIVTCVTPFCELRAFARKKLPAYQEIYLKHGIESCIKRDIKSVYKQNMAKGNVVGVDLPFEEPESPDLILQTDKESLGESTEKLFDFFTEKFLKHRS